MQYLPSHVPVSSCPVVGKEKHAKSIIRLKYLACILLFVICRLFSDIIREGEKISEHERRT